MLLFIFLILIPSGFVGDDLTNKILSLMHRCSGGRWARKILFAMSEDLETSTPSNHTSHLSSWCGIQHQREDIVWDARANFMRHMHGKRFFGLGPETEGLPDDHRSKLKCCIEQLFRSFETCIGISLNSCSCRESKGMSIGRFSAL
jgi:hypothetical protein